MEEEAVKLEVWKFKAGKKKKTFKQDNVSFDSPGIFGLNDGGEKAITDLKLTQK